jgi:hemoglobin-like flavoprotein
LFSFSKIQAVDLYESV